MDSIIGTSTLLVLCLMALTAFLVYSVTTVRKLGVIAYLKRIGQLGKVLAGALTKFVANVIGFLATSAQTHDTDKAASHAVQGGVLNSRTGKLDDGTDAAGWYEKD
jgi:hypothetical protein